MPPACRERMVQGSSTQPSILHVIGQLVRGGTEGQMLAVAKAMDARGWRQAVVTFNPGDAWDDRVTDMGLPLYGIPRNTLKPWRLLRLISTIQRTHPTIVHSWSPHTNFYLALVPRFLGSKRVASLREILSVNTTQGMRLVTPSWLRPFGGFDHATSNSQAAIDAAAKLGLTFSDATITGNLMQVGDDVPTRPLARPMRIMAVGSLNPSKGYDILIRAVALDARQGGECEVHLAGTGPERERLAQRAADDGIGDRVHFAGELDDIPTWLRTGDVLVHPSRSEGLSNSILEAQAHGLPVVATAVGGTSEIVQHEVSGLLVAPDDPAAIVRSLRALRNDPGLVRRLQAGGLASVRALCDPTTIADRYEAVYSRLAQSLPGTE